MMKYKVCFVLTSRADFSLALPIINEFKKDKKLKVSVISSGYLSGNKYGKKIDLIRKHIKKVDLEIKNFPKGDNADYITNSFAEGVFKFSKYFKNYKPDYLFVFADKYEMLSPVIASIQFKIPICHIEGGDLTEGALDDNIRHAITKFSHLHFVSTQEYKRRLIQLGEEPWRISVTGSPSLDLMQNVNFIPKNKLSKKINFDVNKDFILCTFHPVTNELNKTKNYISNLISSLKKQKVNIILTSPNADLTSLIIKDELKKFEKKYKNVKYLEKGEYLDYLSLMKYCKFMIGNSSSGIIESASLKTKVINIGNRQKGRVIPKNVINCGYKRNEILIAINKVKKFKPIYFNPYYKKNISKKIHSFFKSNMNKNIVNKRFVDI